jgi:CheY-like chemotaxis protein
VNNVIVFLVEDDVNDRRFAKEVLEKAGHKVALEATTLPDAIAIIKRGDLAKYGITVAVVDGYLPNAAGEKTVWAGPTVAHAIRNAAPLIKIVSSSSLPERDCGYGDVHAWKLDGAKALCGAIQKL